MAAIQFGKKLWQWLTLEKLKDKQRDEANLKFINKPSTEVISIPPTKRVRTGGSLIFFVHGLAGSPESTWSSMLRVLESDATLTSFSYDCYSFPTSLWRPPLGTRMPNIQQLAEGLRTHLEVHHSSEKNIHIVAHSLGGVIVRQLILDCSKGEIPIPFAGVMLIASPHAGASLAALGHYLSSDHKHLAQLSEESDILDLINRDWVTLRIEESLQTVYVVGGVDAVVPPASAAPYLGQRNVQTLIGYGHRDILEPVDTLDTRYKIVQNFLLGVNSSREKATTKIPITSEVVDPLFDQYSTAVEVFYYDRPHDNALTLVGEGRAAWLTGPSGSGKTVALFRRALKSDCKVHNISLDTYPGLSSHALLCEICSSLNDRAGKENRFAHDTSIRTLETELRKAVPSIGSRIAVIIEEVPLSEGQDLSSFATVMAKFFQMNRDAGCSSEIIWLISSLGDPRHGLGHQTGKVLDIMEVIPIEAWNSQALHELIDLLVPSLNIPISESEKKYLVQAANGSPRFLKIALRQKRGQSHRSLSDLVDALRIEWRQQ